MKKVIFLLAILSLSFGAFSCGGGGSSAPTLPSGENAGIPTVIQLLPSQFVAQTNSNITLNAKVLDGNGVPIAGVPVIFTNLSGGNVGVVTTALRWLGIRKAVGILSATVANTASNGIATVTISSTTSGFATILVQVNNGVGNVRDSKTVFFTSAVSLSLQPTLTLDVSSVGPSGPFDQPGDFILFKAPGDNQRTIMATVYDQFGLPSENASVAFSSDATSGVTFTPATATTNANGQAFTVVQVSPTILTNQTIVLNISATATLPSGSTAFNLLSLFLSPVTVSESYSSLTANPTSVGTAGTSTVTAVVMTDLDTPVPDGTSVNFSASCGSITPFAQTTGGVTTASFIAPLVPESCTVTGEVSGVTIGTVNITVTLPLSVQPGVLTVEGVTGDPAATFTIFGGVPPYSIIPSNPVFGQPAPVMCGTAQCGATFAINVPPDTPPISVTYTVADTTGTTVPVTLNVVANIVGLTVMPSSQTVTPGAGIAGSGIPPATFDILGGLPPYQVVSDTLAYQPVPPTITPPPGSSSGAFTVSVPVDAGAQTVTFTITDATGTQVTAKMTIATTIPDFYLLPSEATIPVFGAITFQIIGGVPDPVLGFGITVDNPSLVDTSGYDPSINPRALTVVGLATGTVNIIVTDMNGLQATATLTIQ